MTRLKIILQYKYTVWIFLAIILSYVIFCLNNVSAKSQSSDIRNYEGIIKDLEIDGNHIKIYIDDFLINYYVNNKEELDDYNIGDKIRVLGIANLPDTARNFDQFNYRHYLLSKKIYYIVEAKSVCLLEKNKNIIYELKQLILNKIANRSTSGYLRTFLLGDNSMIDNDVMTSYQKNGISHLFALSGMHVSLLTSLIMFLVQKVTSKKIIKYGVVICFLFLYVMLTNYSLSIMRAVLLFIFCFLNNYFEWNIKNEYLLIYILGFSLLYNPFYVYNNGFLFSYIVTYSLIKFGYIINSYHNYFVKLFLISFIAFLVSIPIMVNSYFGINVITPVINLFFVPLVCFIMFPLALLTCICPYLDNCFLVIINIVEQCSLLVSKINWFYIALAHIPSYVISLYYIIIYFVIINFPNKEYKYIVGLVILILIHYHINYFKKYATMDIINIGQGDAILITLPHNKGNILIDCGNVINYEKTDWKRKNNAYDVGDDIIVPYLRSQGIHSLDYVIITHGDYDHIGSLSKIIDNFRTKQVIFNSGNDNEMEMKLIQNLKKKYIDYQHFSQNKLNINGYNLYFLNDIDEESENEDSLVIYAKINNSSFILMGDAGFKTEEYIMNEYKLSAVDILKVGHHGSKYSTSQSFVRYLKPQYAFISVGLNNKFNHPDKRVLQALATSKTYLTSINGGIKIIFKSPILVKTVR